MSLIETNLFTSHSGLLLNWKIDCDFIDDTSLDHLASIVESKFFYRDVVGIPRGGLRFAEKLKRSSNRLAHSTLLVDDVLTTGKSFIDMYKPGDLCVVIFARGPCPPFVHPIFRMWE